MKIGTSTFVNDDSIDTVVARQVESARDVIDRIADEEEPGLMSDEAADQPAPAVRLAT